MKKILLAGIFLMTACSAHRDLTGKWVTINHSIEGKLFSLKHRCKYASDGMLLLNQDSSFEMLYKCVMMNGKKWQLVNDSLRLYTDTEAFRNSEAKSFAPPRGSRDYMSMRVRRNRIDISSKIYSKSGEPGDTVLHYEGRVMQLYKREQ
jgi:hypothetical protein